MDTIRHSQDEQADMLSWHIDSVVKCGLAGTVLFSWTDEWHTGNSAITDWAFGLTYADRAPKASLSAVRELFEQPLCGLLAARPKVSVVVCSYNGGRTLEQCLDSLLALNYPDFEVIVVDDGSTDDTREILSRFPSVRRIHQPVGKSETIQRRVLRQRRQDGPPLRHPGDVQFQGRPHLQPRPGPGSPGGDGGGGVPVQ